MIKKKVLSGLLVGAVIGLVGASIAYVRPAFLEGLELTTYDMRARSAADPDAADPRIVLLNIDDGDLAWVKQGSAGMAWGWPWPRELFAWVTDYLLKAGARAVVYDLIFSATNGDPTQDEAFAKALAAKPRTVIGLELTHYEWRHRKPSRIMARLATFPSCDAPRAKRAADQLVWYQQRVVLLPTAKRCELWMGGARSLSELKDTLESMAQAEILSREQIHGAVLRTLPKSAFSHEINPVRVATTRGALPLEHAASIPAPDYPLLRPPALALTRAARFLGVVKQKPDADGVFRHYAPVMRHRGKLYPSLALAAALAAYPDRKLSVHDGRLRWGDVSIPPSDRGQVAIHFHGPRETYSTVGVRHILNVLAQRSEHDHYRKTRAQLMARLKDAVQDDARLPRRIRATLVDLWRAFGAHHCAVRPTGALSLLANIPEHPTWHTLRVQHAAAALAASPVAPACRQDAQKGLERIKRLRRRFNTNPKRVRKILEQARSLAYPKACKKQALAHLRRIAAIMSLKKAAPKRAMAAVRQWQETVRAKTCDPVLRNSFRRELLRTDRRYPNRFKHQAGLHAGDPRGRIFIVNVAAAGLRDIKASPLDDLHLGGEITATFLDNLLHGDFVRRCPRWLTALLTLLLCVVLGAGTFLIIALTRSALWVTTLSLAVSVAVVGAYVLAAFLVYEGHFVWMDAVTPSLAAAVTWIASLSTNFYSEGKSRRFVQDALGRYTSPVLVRELMANPERLSLDFGEKRELTVFFSDLQGFTSISERLTPEQLVHLLNEYLTEMTDIILEEDGIVDKYIGDAIMAFWGAPHDDPDHAVKACRATVRMQLRLAELRPRWQKEYGEEVIARCGLNSGFAIAGNMGSRHKFNYTLMGDTVNLASRLEGANKPYKTVVMIGENTYEKVRDKIIARELDFLAVKGKDEPVRVHELMGFRDEVAPREAERAERFNQALDVYRQTKFAEAMERFQSIIDDFDGDGPSRLYITRCRDYIRHPPPLDWDGVFRMTTK